MTRREFMERILWSVGAGAAVNLARRVTESLSAAEPPYAGPPYLYLKRDHEARCMEAMLGSFEPPLTYQGVPIEYRPSLCGD